MIAHLVGRLISGLHPNRCRLCGERVHPDRLAAHFLLEHAGDPT